MGIAEKWKEYERQKDAFAASHNPATCKACGREIMPGNDVVCHDNDPFCCENCLLEYIGAETFIFNADDDEYASFFEKKGDKK